MSLHLRGVCTTHCEKISRFRCVAAVTEDAAQLLSVGKFHDFVAAVAIFLFRGCVRVT